MKVELSANAVLHDDIENADELSEDELQERARDLLSEHVSDAIDLDLIDVYDDEGNPLVRA